MSLKFNPTTGELDLVGGSGPAPAGSANAITIESTADETISALKLVYFNSATTSMLADNTAYTSSLVAGVALNSGVTGNNISIREIGKVEDASFTYSLGQPLFLGNNGSIQTTQPASGNYLTQIGFGLGLGAIYVRINNPKLL